MHSSIIIHSQDSYVHSTKHRNVEAIAWPRSFPNIKKVIIIIGINGSCQKYMTIHPIYTKEIQIVYFIFGNFSSKTFISSFTENTPTPNSYCCHMVWIKKKKNFLSLFLANLC